MCFMELLFCIRRFNRLVHMIVHYKNMYDVQLSSQILFSGLHVRSFKSFGAAVEWFIIVGHKCIQLSFIHNHLVGWAGRI